MQETMKNIVAFRFYAFYRKGPSLASLKEIEVFFSGKQSNFSKDTQNFERSEKFSQFNRRKLGILGNLRSFGNCGKCKIYNEFGKCDNFGDFGHRVIFAISATLVNPTVFATSATLASLAILAILSVFAILAILTIFINFFILAVLATRDPAYISVQAQMATKG